MPFDASKTRKSGDVLVGTLALIGGTDPVAPNDVHDIASASPEAALYAALEHLAAGRLGLAVRVVDEVTTRASARLAERPVVALQLQMARNWATLLRGDVLEAEATADREYFATVQGRADYPRVGWCLVRGVIALVRGLPRRAVSTLPRGHRADGFRRPRVRTPDVGVSRHGVRARR